MTSDSALGLLVIEMHMSRLTLREVAQIVRVGLLLVALWSVWRRVRMVRNRDCQGGDGRNGLLLVKCVLRPHVRSWLRLSQIKAKCLLARSYRRRSIHLWWASVENLL